MNQKNICLGIFIFSILILNLIVINSINNQIKIQEGCFRLHVTANSNTKEDQLKKLTVASKVEKYINTITKKSANINDIYENLESNISSISEIDENISKVKIGKMNYSKRENKLYSMNAGTYNSINVILESGKGKNFWTLISPLEDENKEKLNNSDIYFLPSTKLKTSNCESIVLNLINFLNKKKVTSN